MSCPEPIDDATEETRRHRAARRAHALRESNARVTIKGSPRLATGDARTWHFKPLRRLRRDMQRSRDARSCRLVRRIDGTESAYREAAAQLAEAEGTGDQERARYLLGVQRDLERETQALVAACRAYLSRGGS